MSDASFDLDTVCETDALAGEVSSLARALYLLVSEFPLNDERSHAAGTALSRVVMERAEALDEALTREREARHAAAKPKQQREQ